MTENCYGSERVGKSTKKVLDVKRVCDARSIRPLGAGLA
jgi:hypothetical protein